MATFEGLAPAIRVAGAVERLAARCAKVSVLSGLATASLTAASIVSCDEETVSCELAGGAALLDLRSGTYFSVNPVGAYVWELLRAPVAVSDVHGALTARYDVEPEQCYADLIELLQQLAGAGLIKVADGTGS